MFLNSRMCESCQAKINFLTRRVCSGCNRYFCQRCVSTGSISSGAAGVGVGSTAGAHRKSPQVCRRCTVFSYPVMERGHLSELSLRDLKHYKGIDTPLNASKDILIQLILGHQARILTEHAQKAVSQLQTHQIDVLSVDASTLQPPSTAYSSGNGLNRSATGSLAVAQTTSVAADIRSRVKKQMDLRKSTDVLDTSGITRIEELSNESQIDMLTVRQLKMILQRNCIDYHGCVEKTELMERVHRLYKDKLEQKEVESKLIAGGDTEAEHDYMCKVCMDSAVDCVFLNCGHMLTCVKCGRQLTECPVCRQYIVKVIHAFRV